jgi:hypothetical protein
MDQGELEGMPEPAVLRLATSPDFRRWWAHDWVNIGADQRKRGFGGVGSCYYSLLGVQRVRLSLWVW